MIHREKVEDEIEFWLEFISNWESKYTEPVPDRAQQLLKNALLKLESCYPEKN